MNFQWIPDTARRAVFQKFILVFSLLSLTGCATLFSGTTDKISISSDIEGIRVFIEGRLVGKTPIEVEVPRTIQTRGVLARFEKENFKTQEFRLQRKFNTTAIWNLTSLPSWATDVLSGAWYEYAPLKYHIELEPTAKTAGDRHFRKRRLIYRYVVANYDQIMQDLSRGGGEYLNSLAFIITEGESQIGEFVNWIRQRQDSLLRVESRYQLIETLNRTLGAHPNLRGYRI